MPKTILLKEATHHCFYRKNTLESRKHSTHFREWNMKFSNLSIIIALCCAGITQLGTGNQRILKFAPVPENLNLSNKTKSSSGNLQIELFKPETVLSGDLYEWNACVYPAMPTQIEFLMPQHGHGPSSLPSIIPAHKKGCYLIKGLKFQMVGWWRGIFKVNLNPNESEYLSIDFKVTPP